MVRLGPFSTSGIWSMPQPRRRGRPHIRPRALLLHTPRPNRPPMAPGPAPVAIDRSGPRSRISTSAVTVKVAKRSASGPDTAGASGPGLAPPPGAARSILQVRRAPTGRGRPPPRAAADHQGSLSGRERRLGSGTTRQDLSLRPSLIRTPALAGRHAMAARSKPACSAIASPKGSLTERLGWSTHLPSRWGRPPTQPGRPYQRQVPPPRPDRLIRLHTAGRPTPRQWAGRRWRRAVLVRPRRRPLAGPPGALGGSRE